jgi:hypothetical protein
MKPSIALLALATIVAGARARAQEVPCRATPCTIIFDWGGGQSSTAFTPDRRYGTGDDFEVRFRAALRARGYQIREGNPEGVIVMTVRLTLQKKVMCDQQSGTNNDMTCTAITSAAVTFASPDPKLKVPGNVRVNNRCAQNGIFLKNDVFGQYAGDLLWWQLEGDAQKAPKPTVSC